MPSLPKSDKKELVEQIRQMTLMGGLPSDIGRYLEGNGTALTRRQLKTLHQKAAKKITEDAGDLSEESRENLIRFHFALGRFLLKGALEMRDIRTAHQIAQSERELLNLNPPKKTEITGGYTVLNITTEVITDRKDVLIEHDSQDFSTAPATGGVLP